MRRTGLRPSAFHGLGQRGERGTAAGQGLLTYGGDGVGVRDRGAGQFSQLSRFRQLSRLGRLAQFSTPWGRERFGVLLRIVGDDGGGESARRRVVVGAGDGQEGQQWGSDLDPGLQCLAGRLCLPVREPVAFGDLGLDGVEDPGTEDVAQQGVALR